MATVETKTTINGKIVEKVDSFGNIDVFRLNEESESEPNEATLFFCSKNNGSVMRTMVIGADASQNFGYVSDITFKDPDA